MGVLRVLFLFLVIFIAYSSQHSYGLGECPEVTPMNNFKMRPMLGIWYVIKKTATNSACITYNFTATHTRNKYHLQQESHSIIPGKAHYHYNGELTVPNAVNPAKMKVKFALNLIPASYIVVITDYHNYAAIFTCQRIAFGNRKSVSILSRKRTIDDDYMQLILNTLKSFKLNPNELSTIAQVNCDKQDDGLELRSVSGTSRSGDYEWIP
ncbi:apolipoprotein d [Holotrichia oblita]|uniref:Apolipoprotein d n=1 Tax=Holotrichia oblita TaxID=644536 RepID=A0ACB9SHF2_HOLOL|nr:apolipoprotein d [Holotrichia oblita]